MQFADTGVEDNGSDDEEEEVKDVAEEVEGYSSGGRDEILLVKGFIGLWRRTRSIQEIMTSMEMAI
jgi:hypothetical protein